MREVPQYSQTGGQGQSVVELGVARADAEDAGVARQPVQGEVILIVTRTHHLTHQILLMYSFQPNLDSLESMNSKSWEAMYI